jgi:hypothetical protein
MASKAVLDLLGPGCAAGDANLIRRDSMRCFRCRIVIGDTYLDSARSEKAERRTVTVRRSLCVLAKVAKVAACP